MHHNSRARCSALARVQKFPSFGIIPFSKVLVHPSQPHLGQSRLRDSGKAGTLEQSRLRDSGEAGTRGLAPCALGFQAVLPFGLETAFPGELQAYRLKLPQREVWSGFRL